jgi:hypothetical protein
MMMRVHTLFLPIASFDRLIDGDFRKMSKTLLTLNYSVVILMMGFVVNEY